MTESDVVIVGAGPMGVEIAVGLKRAGIRYLHLEAGQIGHTMLWWPPLTPWFSSPERIAIAGVPIQTVSQARCTREEYLAYLRSLVLQFDLEVLTYETVVDLGRPPHGSASLTHATPTPFELTTRTHTGRTRRYAATRAVVLATGGMARPNRLNLPGEDLPHVSHYLGEPHAYFRRRVVIVGGRNSAVEAALRLYHAGAQVAISYRGRAFPDRVKYWLRPEIEHLVATGRIAAHFETAPAEITPTHVRLQPVGGGVPIELPADFVLLLVGHVADMSLFRRAGVTLEGHPEVPRFDPQTMETDVPGLYVAGTASAGTQRSGVRVFLENCHVHAGRIVAALTGAAPPAEPRAEGLPEA